MGFLIPQELAIVQTTRILRWRSSVNMASVGRDPRSSVSPTFDGLSLVHF